MRTTRNRIISRAADVSRLAGPGVAPERRFVGQVVRVNVAPAKGNYVLVQPVTVGFVEAENQAVTFANYGMPVPVAVLNGTPAVGETLICTTSGSGRWIADRSGTSQGSGSGGVQLPNCACVTPYTITMTSRDPNCNYGMFQSCTIQYGPLPAEMAAFGLTGNGYTSNERFVDRTTGESFYYYFRCFQNQYQLSQVYPVSAISSPFRSGIEYTWVVGVTNQYGFNNCPAPPGVWHMYNGTAYPGSDASCSIDLVAASTQVVPQ